MCFVGAPPCSVHVQTPAIVHHPYAPAAECALLNHRVSPNGNCPLPCDPAPSSERALSVTAAAASYRARVPAPCRALPDSLPALGSALASARPTHTCSIHRRSRNSSPVSRVSLPASLAVAASPGFAYNTGGAHPQLPRHGRGLATFPIPSVARGVRASRRCSRIRTALLKQTHAAVDWRRDQSNPIRAGRRSPKAV